MLKFLLTIGGWQILIESKQNPHYQSILNSTHGIFFFGTPHQGLRTDELEGVVDVDSTQRHNLIMQLKEGSEFLETQKEHLLPIFKTLQGLKVVSFYETVKTASVGMVIKALCALFPSGDYLLHIVGIRRHRKR